MILSNHKGRLICSFKPFKSQATILEEDMASESTTAEIIKELSMITTTIAPSIEDLEEHLFDTTVKPTILEDSLFESSTTSTTSTTISTAKPKEMASEMDPKGDEIPTETTTEEILIAFGE